MTLIQSFLLTFLLSYCTIATDVIPSIHDTHGVTVIPSIPGIPKPYKSPIKPAESAYDIVSRLNTSLVARDNTQFIGNYYMQEANSSSYAMKDSFVHGAIEANTHNQHLALRPQDVWLTILSQMSMYLRKHGNEQEVRSKWDNIRPSSIAPKNEYILAYMEQQMRPEIERRAKAGWLGDWLRPQFSTSNHTWPGSMASVDGTIAAVLMMSEPTKLSPKPTEKNDPFPCANGIPSITLFGVQKDWEILQAKVEKLKEFGKEPTLYSISLQPILKRLVDTFQNPNSPHIRRFWNDIVTLTPIQGLCTTTSTVTGWVNAFHHWHPSGSLLASELAPTQGEQLNLDGITYPWQHTSSLQTTYNTFPLCMMDSRGGARYEMIAGMLAVSINNGAPRGYTTAMQTANVSLSATISPSDHGTYQPFPFYSIYRDRTFSDPACENEKPSDWANRPPGSYVPEKW